MKRVITKIEDLTKKEIDKNGITSDMINIALSESGKELTSVAEILYYNEVFRMETAEEDKILKNSMNRYYGADDSEGYYSRQETGCY